jgi:hypothetical protein
VHQRQLRAKWLLCSRRTGASVLAPEMSWSHNLRIFLVGVRKRSSLCTISANNSGRHKKPYHNCGELSDARHSRGFLLLSSLSSIFSKRLL